MQASRNVLGKHGRSAAADDDEYSPDEYGGSDASVLSFEPKRARRGSSPTIASAGAGSIDDTSVHSSPSVIPAVKQEFATATALLAFLVQTKLLSDLNVAKLQKKINMEDKDALLDACLDLYFAESDLETAFADHASRKIYFFHRGSDSSMSQWLMKHTAFKEQFHAVHAIEQAYHKGARIVVTSAEMQTLLFIARGAVVAHQNQV
jgi:hypothetical protein